MAATFNQWGDDIDESLGDIVEEKLEEKVKDEAKDAAKEGAEEAAKAAGRGLDKLTDKIDPVKKVKDQAKNLWHNNPIAKAKRAVKGAIDKAKQAVAKLAKQGIQAVGKAALAAAKGALSFLAANPVVAVVVIVIVVGIVVYLNIDPSDVSDSYDSSSQVDSDLVHDFEGMNAEGMTDDDVVILLMNDCGTNQFDPMDQIDVEMEEQAKLVYSIFRSYGFNNASIAGILGNMECESKIDPAGVEGIYERGILGEKKSNALVDLPKYTEDVLFPVYREDNTDFNPSGYETQDAAGQTIYHCGIGIVQWTGPAAMDLRKVAQTFGIDWYNMDFQMAYLVADCFYRNGFFSEWVVNQDEDTGVDAAREAGFYFCEKFEGNERRAPERRDPAERWYNTIQDWGDDQIDQPFVDNILAMAEQLGAIVEFMDVRDSSYTCMNGQSYDNSSLANAAISFAWANSSLALNNNGTELYQKVHDEILPHDHTYKSCDRVVALAVLWSGTDDDYKTGTTNQYNYLESSAKWEKLGTSSSVSIDELQPGDVFCTTNDASHDYGHTFIYTGEELIQLAHGSDANAGSNSVSGSIGTRAATCDASTTTYLGGSRVYGVYRCIDPDNSDTYRSIGSGMSGLTYN